MRKCSACASVAVEFIFRAWKDASAKFPRFRAENGAEIFVVVSVNVDRASVSGYLGVENGGTGRLGKRLLSSSCFREWKLQLRRVKVSGRHGAAQAPAAGCFVAEVWLLAEAQADDE